MLPVCKCTKMVTPLRFFQIMSQPLGYLIRFPLSIQLKSFQHWFKFLILSFSFTGGLFAYRDVPSVPSVPKVSSVVSVRKSALLYKKNIAPFAPTPRRAPIAKKSPFVPSVKLQKLPKRVKPVRLAPKVKRAPVAPRVPFVRLTPKRLF